ncbi:MAG: rRNA synthase [Verrucomicrobiota bacterium]|jgi:hypothetical protein
MSDVFELNHEALATDPRFAEFATKLNALSPIDSQAAFNRYCREACRLWDKHFRSGVGKTSAHFAELLQRVERGGEDVIQTGWGGVVITLHEPPRIQKYLVIRKGGYLALEKHEQKDERLEIREGAGLLLSREKKVQPLTVTALAPGQQFHFEPGMEHCVIGTENLLIFERSIDPKGMDQDLIFIYTPAPDSGSIEQPVSAASARDQMGQ